MATIRVSANELRARAQQLANLVAALKALLEEFDAAVEALAAQWEGEARDAFLNAAKQDKAQIENLIKFIEQFIQALLEIARKYEEAEQRNFDLALERKR